MEVVQYIKVLGVINVDSVLIIKKLSKILRLKWHDVNPQVPSIGLAHRAKERLQNIQDHQDSVRLFMAFQIHFDDAPEFWTIHHAHLPRLQQQLALEHQTRLHRE